MSERVHRIIDLLRAHAASQSEALLAPGRSELTYQQLYDHVNETACALAGLGVSAQSRVALVLPEGPELAVAFLSTASCATCMPVNPDYVENEFVQYFTAMRVSFLITAHGMASAAQSAAAVCDIPIIQLEALAGESAGIFSLHGKSESEQPALTADQLFQRVQPDDTALILTTSGTTARPKSVPLTHRLLCQRASARIPTYRITPQDRLLNIMPMFHSSSLTYLLTSLMAGASVVCLPRFYARDFFRWLDEFGPTWCSASASMYQTILAYAPHNQHVLQKKTLRFLRAGSMALPVPVWQQIEAVFDVPVLQGYSSAESGEIATNPLPPRPRKPGSVGLPINSQVMVVDESGKPVAPGISGEIVVRGSSVFNGYENDPEATQQAFQDGWLRTGDQGYIDDDGYLFLQGRIKEGINRGGEKVFPAEVETVLLTHPAVKEAAVFGVPDPRLGHTVGTAVVLREGAVITPGALRAFVAEQLAYFKVPEHLVLTDSLPYSANGKLQRRGLAEKLGLTPSPSPPPEPAFAAPRTLLEERVVALWSDILGRSPIGIHDQFQTLGGDSIGAARLVSAMRQRLRVNVTLLDLFEASTPAEQAAILERIIDAGNVPRAGQQLVPIRRTGSQPPLFCFHALQGGVYMYRGLLPFLDLDQPVYGLQAVGIDGLDTPFEDTANMALLYRAQIQTVQPQGPYWLCGYSFGGRLALETARCLRDAGHEAFTLIIDDHLHVNRDNAGAPRRNVIQRLGSLCFGLFRLPARYRRIYLRERLAAAVRPKRSLRPDVDDSLLPAEIQRVKAAHKAAVRRYVPRPYGGPVTYLRSGGDIVNIPLFKTLRYICKGPLDIIDLPGPHSSLMRENIQETGEQVKAWLARTRQLEK